MLTKDSFITAATASFSNDSTSITWHQLQYDDEKCARRVQKEQQNVDYVEVRVRKRK
jgi:hypothetical protein